ncbi:AAA family ATPase, putative [Theileria annulata]|uniref:AAA family ATPase, putative n=1 Tax=Theileria annulata TaxID=5874 RepID=Q4UB78_THEAN|nr:AAA family ATPase, putative [Theileria annulata]CAI75923.1 AAA family ATPase, putative [Theileria annulata]|eukprot:XP_955399.1 AAA family ATPase, putative [Theileria annulata]
MSSFGFGRSLPIPNTNQSSNKDDNNITGKFDPTALERGAKALRMLDSSPNAQKAFELTKLQEMTKQQELQMQIEQMRLKQGELGTQKARVESDERKKLLSHQQEQERITAQYKAKLEDEMYQKKLHDQRKQNEEWLQRQHEQFLKQEQIRKKTETEILNMKKEHLKQEKELERQNLIAKVREENMGRIKQERDNFDIHLKMMKERSVEERKTKLESLKTIFSSLGSGIFSLLNDKQRLTYTALTLTGLSLGIYSAKNGTKVARKVIEQKIGKPSLVRETSKSIITNNIKSFWDIIKGKKKQMNLNEIVLNHKLSERLNWSINSLLKCKENKTPYRNILLYGPPGTGKTLFAKTLAMRSGMDYAIMTGGDVGPLKEDAVTELNKLFKWSNKSKKGLILFIDEAESFLRQGRSTLQGMSENIRNALSTFLYHTGNENNNFCLILATNEKDILDKAVVDRIDESYNFDLPEEEERKRMIKLFMEQYVINPLKRTSKVLIDEGINDEYYEKLAKKTQGLSGRQISKLCISLQSAVYGSGAKKLTVDLADTVIDWHLKNQND